MPRIPRAIISLSTSPSVLENFDPDGGNLECIGLFLMLPRMLPDFSPMKRSSLVLPVVAVPLFCIPGPLFNHKLMRQIVTCEMGCEDR